MSILSPNVIYGLYCQCQDCIEKQKTHVRYVGLTRQGVERRYRDHLRGSDEHYAIYRWMKKHGKDNVKYRVLEEVEAPEMLPEREIFWIAELDTYSHESKCGGLNLTRGGDGVFGLVHSEETRARLSESNRVRFADPAARQAAAEATQRLYEERPEVKEAIAETVRLLWQDPEYRHKNTVNKSEAARKGWDKPGQKEKWVASRKESGVTAALHEGNRRKYAEDPEYRKRVQAGLKKARHTKLHVNKGKTDPECDLCETTSP